MLKFEFISTTGKTDKYVVQTESNPFLGEIRWYAPWRRYVFYPQLNTLFDASCLDEIVSKLRQLMNDRRALD